MQIPVKKTVFLFTAAVLAAGLLAGCGKKKETDSGEPMPAPVESAAEEMTGLSAGISFPNETEERWKNDAAAISGMLKSHGYDAKILYAGDNTAQQNTDIESLVSGGVSLLIVAACDENGLVQSMTKAKEAGIPVIAYDRLIRNTDAVTEYVAFDDYLTGHLQAQFILDKLGLKEAETSKLYHMEFAAGDRSDLRQGYYFNGAYDTLRPFLESGALHVTSGEVTFSEAAADPVPADPNVKNSTGKTVADVQNERMKRILSEFYPDATQLDAVLCLDDEAAAGVIKAVGSGYYGKNDVIITGMGAADQNLSLIRDGKQSMTVSEFPERLHKVTAALAISIMKGESPDEVLIGKEGLADFIRYDTESYDNGTGVIEAYLAKPEVVTGKTLEAEGEKK